MKSLNESAALRLGWIVFVHNVFASLQDVSSDALAVDLLAEKERGEVLARQPV